MYTVLVAAGENTLVGDGLGPEYSQDSSEVLLLRFLVWKVDTLIILFFSHPHSHAFSAVQ